MKPIILLAWANFPHAISAAARIKPIIEKLGYRVIDDTCQDAETNAQVQIAIYLVAGMRPCLDELLLKAVQQTMHYFPFVIIECTPGVHYYRLMSPCVFHDSELETRAAEDMP